MIYKITQGIYSFFLVFATAMITKYLVNLGLENFYDLLDIPDVTPEHSYFKYVWNILYVLLFLGFYLALISKQNREQFLDLNVLFGVQLFLQILWAFCFFYLEQIWASVILIFLLDIVVALLMHSLFFINGWAFILLIPYLLWLLFASYLNVFIACLN